jgi:hypothetical protein
MKRLILATLCGTLLSALLLSLDLIFVDERAMTTLQALHNVTAPLAVFAFVSAILFVIGALPTILIGAILRYLHRASPATIVLTPAILFSLTLAEVALRMRDASLVLECLPALVAGGLAMFWVLASGKNAQATQAMR